MKLEGSLDAFSLADVLNLLHATAKTGALSLAHEGRGAVIHLVDGQVAGAAGESLSGLGVLRRLVAQGIVDEDAVTDAALAAADSGDGLVTCLLAANRLDSDIAREVTRDLAVDTIFDLLRWDDGAFSFAADERPQDDVALREAPEVLVAEATDRMTSWVAAMDAVPSPRAVPLVQPVDDDLEIAVDEWNLLMLVNGERSVDDLVQLGGQGTFSLVTRLMALAERGLIAFHESGTPDFLAERLQVLQMLDVAAGQVQDDADDADDVHEVSGEDAPIADPADHVEVAPAAPAASERESTEADRTTGGSTVVTVAVPAPEPVSERNELDPRAAMLASERPGQAATNNLLGGAHTPGDVVPPRPEPFLPTRRPDHGDAVDQSIESGIGIIGANAVVTEVMPDEEPADQADDALINRSMVLRLIAGVRGL